MMLGLYSFTVQLPVLYEAATALTCRFACRGRLQWIPAFQGRNQFSIWFIPNRRIPDCYQACCQSRRKRGPFVIDVVVPMPIRNAELLEINDSAKLARFLQYIEKYVKKVTFTGKKKEMSAFPKYGSTNISKIENRKYYQRLMRFGATTSILSLCKINKSACFSFHSFKSSTVESQTQETPSLVTGKSLNSSRHRCAVLGEKPKRFEIAVTP